MHISVVRATVISILLLGVLFSGCILDQGPVPGTIQLTSSPTGAEIYLDSQFRGSTPSTIANLQPGNHTLEFRSTGYKSWSSVIIVPAGTSSYFAALVPLASLPVQQSAAEETSVPPGVTIGADHSPMIVGDSITFSGTCTVGDSVVLTLYGPGYYANGVQVDTERTNALHVWSFTWNPGTSIQAGTYTMIVTDARKSTSAQVKFSVVGGGLVSITSNSYAASRGDTLRFSGRCTTGAQNVQLILYGPDRFGAGVNLGTISVGADQTWNFRYTLDNSVPTGTYTAYVYDVPRTTSDTTRFTVGFAS
jgi:hypothetical protein